MNRKNKEFGEVVSVRLSEQEKENLDKLCRVLSVTKSEFLRNRILGINQAVIKTPAMKKLSDKKVTGKIMEELTGTKQTAFIAEEHEGETPAGTTEELIEQLKHQKEN